MHDTMRKVFPPAVVMAAAEAAIRTTAQLWGFRPTTAVEAVMAKVEERQTLTFGMTNSMQTREGQRQAMYKLLHAISAGATDAIIMATHKTVMCARHRHIIMHQRSDRKVQQHGTGNSCMAQALCTAYGTGVPATQQAH